MSAVLQNTAAAAPLVRLQNLNKHYGDFTAVDDLSLDIQEGEFLTFLGSSGSGKSTTLSMLAGFETPSSGAISVAGRSLLRVPPHQRDIGMVFQRYSLFPHLSVRDNIGFPLDIRKVGAAERNKKVDAMLRLVQLEAFAHRRPAQLVLQVFAQLLVQRAQGFVQQDHRGAIDEAAGQGDALLLAAGELLRVTAREVAHPHHVEGVVDRLRDVDLAPLAHA